MTKFSISNLKQLVIVFIIISFLATWLNQLGILQYPPGAITGTIFDIGSILGLISAIVAIRLVLRIPDN